MPLRYAAHSSSLLKGSQAIAREALKITVAMLAQLQAARRHKSAASTFSKVLNSNVDTMIL